MAKKMKKGLIENVEDTMANLKYRPKDVIIGGEFGPENRQVSQLAAIRRELMIVHAGIAIIVILMVVQILLKMGGIGNSKEK